ncbi:MAG: spondin domain-containing protein [Marinifilaceae bacterium]
MKLNGLLLLLSVGLLMACSDDDNDTDTTPIEKSARYRITVTGNWTGINHPTDYPANAHFSPVIGMAHKAGATIFSENELASDGIEVMAETGATSPLDDEIRDRIDAGEANLLIKEGGLATGDGEISFELTINRDFPLITLVSMLAPSPDWFIAAKNINLLENDKFITEVTIDAVAYDSGTDSGSTFTSPNADTNPAENISKITSAPLGNGNEVTPPLVRIQFSKL